MSEQKFRVESDLLGELQVPAEAYYGVQTQRGINNYHISRKKMRDYPEFVNAIAYVKLAAVQANHSLGVINDEISGAISQACREILEGKLHENFPIDMMQGGAGTSVNMNANEVIANRALEIMGHQKGEYQYCYPNDHCNCGQSTNDVYPTTIRLTFILLNKRLVESLTRMIKALRDKGEEYKNTIKMGRTQLQDAVPMTSGQEFNAFANNLEEEIANLNRNAVLLNADITNELLIAIFWPNNPLHDGALIIDGEKILAAGCYLPLTENAELSRWLGTRHRAAIGVTEVSDAVSLIVSEERGELSLAINGRLSRNLNETQVRKYLVHYFSDQDKGQGILDNLKEELLAFGNAKESDS